MARVSLIVLEGPGVAWPSGRMAACRAGLEDRGHAVEVLVVADPRGRRAPGPDEPWCDRLVADGPGLARAAVAGLRAARGRWLVLLDLAMAYPPEDVFAVVDRLATAEGEVVAVAARPAGGLARALARRLAGTADPSSGLIGLTLGSAIEADGSFAPVGSRFALEVLARVGGPRVDVEVGPVAAGPRTSPRMDDVRFLKRLADDRFGTASRLIQFCIVGASGMVVDLTSYALLQAALAASPLAGVTTPLLGEPLDLAGAAVLAIALALTWNFSLNRRLTFNDARDGSIVRQYVRYVLGNLVGIGVSLTLRLALPDLFGFFARHRLAAAVAGIVAATGISFGMARWFVFGQSTGAATDPAPAAKPRRAAARPHARPRSAAGPVGPLGSHRERPKS